MYKEKEKEYEKKYKYETPKLDKSQYKIPSPGQTNYGGFKIPKMDMSSIPKIQIPKIR